MNNPWTWISAATIGFAIGNVTSKLALDAGLDPSTLVMVRFVVAAVVIIAIRAARGLITHEEEWRRGSTIGIVNLTLPPLFFTFALVTLSASLAGLLIALIPAATMVGAHFLVPGERFELTRLPGIAVAFGGIAVLLGGVEGVASEDLVTAVLWSMAGVAAAGIGGAISRRFALEVQATRMLVPQFTAAAIGATILGLLVGGVDGLTEAPTEGLAWSLATGAFGTVIPFYSLLRAFDIAETATVALIGYLVPVASAVAAVILLGDPVTGSLVAGGAIVMVGVALADRGKWALTVFRNEWLRRA